MNDKVNLSATIEYVVKNIVSARKGRKCVDGRYLPTQASGMVARPGADCGYVMALMAVSKEKDLGLTPEQCFDSIYAVIKNNRGHFSMHTDHSTDSENGKRSGLIGCGHLAKAATGSLSAGYGLVSEDVVRLVEYARNMAENSYDVEMINLNGDHAEAGVLIVNSKSYSINSQDPKLKSMYFIYDEERDDDFIKALVSEMEVLGVTFDDMKRKSNLQLKATLNNLAAGLPIYSVKFDGERPVVSLVSE